MPSSDDRHRGTGEHRATGRPHYSARVTGCGSVVRLWCIRSRSERSYGAASTGSSSADRLSRASLDLVKVLSRVVHMPREARLNSPQARSPEDRMKRKSGCCASDRQPSLEGSKQSSYRDLPNRVQAAELYGHVYITRHLRYDHCPACTRS
ncbi:uncharacterized protein SCHCODRAFT_01300496 [Schizophyllum commune H4-8]|uniref:uncharacterized protein n=1 Tax=Schizophyllum commune (strain H4-8 / FGSC 9210) TaxID=578458 RepID=UPI00215F8935|nr:uncharacterized protein SCHCODRAFT_01300496 [Schizophyllum commune H4-8]KAI5892274.1 hypothetical protein SCHCODRAFT_01300496 [Schizophyllum commune H4-8]